MSTKTARRAKYGTETLLVGTQLYWVQDIGVVVIRANNHTVYYHILIINYGTKIAIRLCKPRRFG